MAEIQISDDAVREIAHAALLQTLTAEARENVISQAITWMTTPPKRESWHRDSRMPTPLEEAFQMALRSTSTQLVREMMEEDGPVRDFVRGELRTLVEEFSRQLDGDTYNELRTVLIEAMVEHLAAKRAEQLR